MKKLFYLLIIFTINISAQDLIGHSKSLNDSILKDLFYEYVSTDTTTDCMIYRDNNVPQIVQCCYENGKCVMEEIYYLQTRKKEIVARNDSMWKIIGERSWLGGNGGNRLIYLKDIDSVFFSLIIVKI